MNNNDRSGRKTVSQKKLLISGGILIGLIGLLVAIWIPSVKSPATISLSDIATGIGAGKVIKVEDTMLTGELLIHFQDGSTVRAMRDTSSSLLEQLSHLGLTGEQLSKVQFEITKSKTLAAGKVISSVLSLGLIGILAFVALRLVKNSPMMKKNFEEGEIPDMGFDSVAGMDENLQELRDIVTFLKEGDRYAQMGAKMPRGILLVGDPGTGKTLIAKAVAGEAGVPFFAMSGSEFVEMFVGVGAGRVRGLFQKARKRAPCIIFIDEIDAVGRERHGSGGGAEMEQDQTLNQLLVELDGFGSKEGIVVLAATNRIDVLDSALTRPGRFDRQVYVNRPDVKGREAILEVHAKGKKLSPDVSLANVAKATPGLVGADLANIVNEATIMAVRNDHQSITMRDFEEAVEKCIAGGVQRKNRVMSEDERKIIAYHEAGHAITIHELKYCDPVYKVTIIPRGQTGGYTMSLPEHESILMTKNKFLGRITSLMGGRAAEEIFFQDITSGASNDLMVATQLAEEMVMRLGMDTSAGLRVFSQPQGLAAISGPRSSQKTFETIDDSVKSILDGCYQEAKDILTEKRAYVDLVANSLLDVETLSREEFIELMNSQIQEIEVAKALNTD
jgi:cell division protease FtsH